MPGRRVPGDAGGPGDEGEALLAAWLRLGFDERRVWERLAPGASVDEVTSRLSAVPRDFLDEGTVPVALVGDVLGGAPPWSSGVGAVADRVAEVVATGSVRARRAACLALWLWASEDLLGPPSVPFGRGWAPHTVAALAYRLAAVTDPLDWVSDAARREEAARTFLLWCAQVPAGEDAEQARSQLAMRDSLQHDRQLQAALAEHRHREEVTRRLADARAREAAARVQPE